MNGENNRSGSDQFNVDNSSKIVEKQDSNQNVLDFVNDNMCKLDNKNNKYSLKKYKKIIILTLIFFVIIFLALKIKNSSDKDTIPELKIDSYKINVTLKDENVFSVDRNMILSNVYDYYSVSSAISVNGSVFKNIKMEAENTETSTYEEQGYRYFKFQNNEKKITNNKNYLIHYDQVYSNSSLENIEFPFIDSYNSDLSNLYITVNLNNKDYMNYEYEFNHDMDCTYGTTKITCYLDELKKDESLSLKFKKKEIQALAPSTYMKEYLLPVSLLNNIYINNFNVGEYVSISSVGLDGHSELDGDIMKNVRILQFKDSSGNTISSREKEKVKYVVIEVFDQMEKILDKVPSKSQYLILNIWVDYSSVRSEPSIQYGSIIDFILS